MSRAGDREERADAASVVGSEAPASRALALLAAASPLSIVLCACGLGVFAATSPRGSDEPVLVALVTAIPVVVGLSVALPLYFAARGRRPAPWVVLALGALPLVALCAMTVYMAYDLSSDGLADEYEARRMVSDALGMRGVLSGIAAVFAGLTAVGLALGALARRAPGRRAGLGLLIGLACAAPVAALVGYRAIESFDGRREELAVLPLPLVLFALLAVPLAIAGIGRDRGGRSVAFSLGATMALLLAASSTGVMTWMVTASSAARGSSGGAWEALADRAAGALAERSRALVLSVAALAPVLAAGLWGFWIRRGLPSPASTPPSVRVPGPLAQMAPAFVVVALYLLDVGAIAWAEHRLEVTRGSGDQELPIAIEPVDLPTDGHRAELDVAVGDDETVVVAAGRVPTPSLGAEGRARLAMELRRRLRTSGPMRPVQGAAGLPEEPAIHVALDRRVRGASVRGLVGAARDLGAASLYIFRSTGPSGEVGERLRRALPMVLPLLGRRFEGLSILLPAAIPPELDMEQPGWRAVVRPGRIRVAPKAESRVLPFDVNVEQWMARGVAPITPPQLLISSRWPTVVRLAIGDEADAQLVVRVCRWMQALGARVVLVPDVPAGG